MGVSQIGQDVSPRSGLGLHVVTALGPECAEISGGKVTDEESFSMFSTLCDIDIIESSKKPEG